MINLTIQTTTNATLFTAIGGSLAYAANAYKALLPALPRPAFVATAAPIALSVPVAIAVTGAFYGTNLIISAIFALAKEAQMNPLTRSLISGAAVAIAFGFYGVNPLSSIALIVTTIALNSLLNTHIFNLNAAWGF